MSIATSARPTIQATQRGYVGSRHRIPASRRRIPSRAEARCSGRGSCAAGSGSESLDWLDTDQRVAFLYELAIFGQHGGHPATHPTLELLAHPPSLPDPHHPTGPHQLSPPPKL